MSIAFIKRLAWWWRSRCKMVRPSSAYCRSAYEAQAYLEALHAMYVPCRVCGERRCRWAAKRNRPLEMTEERRRQLDYLKELWLRRRD